jgi:hypothetical protein
MGCQFKGRC